MRTRDFSQVSFLTALTSAALLIAAAPLATADETHPIFYYGTLNTEHYGDFGAFLSVHIQQTEFGPIEPVDRSKWSHNSEDPGYFCTSVVELPLGKTAATIDDGKKVLGGWNRELVATYELAYWQASDTPSCQKVDFTPGRTYSFLVHTDYFDVVVSDRKPTRDYDHMAIEPFPNLVSVKVLVTESGFRVVDTHELTPDVFKMVVQTVERDTHGSYTSGQHTMELPRR